MERNVLVGGLSLVTHDKDSCMGEFCTIHNFSDHHMVTWKQMWDERTSRMFRICKHNIAHVDPDELPTRSREHHCDGCCEPSSQFKEDLNELLTEYKNPDIGVTGPVGPIGVAGTTGTTSTSTWSTSGAEAAITYTIGTASGGTYLHAGTGTGTTATLTMNRPKGVDSQ